MHNYIVLHAVVQLTEVCTVGYFTHYKLETV
jgi:hypothetical protein